MAALALKYRPQNFADLVGQLHAAQSLRNAITYGKIGHAYLFHGSRGTGKTSTARILARCLNCVTGPTAEPCGVCEQCTGIAAGSNIDVIEMDAASSRGVDHIRDLRERARVAPMAGRYKIYIIDEVHMLTTEAFNALLKTLEEPPSHVVFILATTELHKIPETILSRCQSFTFRRFSPAEITGRLRTILEKENLTAEEEALHLIAKKAEGSMRDSLSLLDQVLAYAGRETPIRAEQARTVLGVIPVAVHMELLQAVHRRDLRRVLANIDRVAAEGGNLRRFLWDFLEFIKDALLIRKNLNSGNDMPESRRQEIASIVAETDSAELTETFQRLYSVYSNWSVFGTSRMAEIRVSMEMAFVDLFEKLNRPSVAAVLQQLTRLKSAIAEGKSLPAENPPAVLQTPDTPMPPATSPAPPAPAPKALTETSERAPVSDPVAPPVRDEAITADPSQLLAREFMGEDVAGEDIFSQNAP